MPDPEVLTAVQLREPEREIVNAVLREHLPTTRVWVFGSRANWAARPFSDLDLAIDAAVSIGLTKRAEIAEAFEESDLPFRVDVVDLAEVDSSFADRVRHTGVLWRARTNADPLQG